MKRSRRMTGLLAKAPGKALLPLDQAVSKLKEFGNTKFDQTVEIAIRLGIDPKQADQIVRGAVVLPHGIGKTLRVVVFAKGEKADEARAAGADEVGGPDLAEKIKGGWTEFDACIASPDMMGVVGPLGRVLGPKGLMPNPKSGTVTMDLTRAIAEIKAGKIEYRLDKTNIIHCPLGKASFGQDKLAENFKVLMDAVIRAKPAAAKGQYLRSVTITSTMGPGIKINTARLS